MATRKALVLVALLCRRLKLASSCSCFDPGSVLEEYDSAAHIFVGEVANVVQEEQEQEEQILEFGIPLDFHDETVSEFVVTQRFKGAQNNSFTVHSTADSCSFHFEVGTSFLVYTERISSDGTVPVCSRTTKLENVQPFELQELATLSGSDPDLTLANAASAPTCLCDGGTHLDYVNCVIDEMEALFDMGKVSEDETYDAIFVAQKSDCGTSGARIVNGTKQSELDMVAVASSAQSDGAGKKGKKKTKSAKRKSVKKTSASAEKSFESVQSVGSGKIKSGKKAKSAGKAKGTSKQQSVKPTESAEKTFESEQNESAGNPSSGKKATGSGKSKGSEKQESGKPSENVAASSEPSQTDSAGKTSSSKKTKGSKKGKSAKKKESGTPDMTPKTFENQENPESIAKPAAAGERGKKTKGKKQKRTKKGFDNKKLLLLQSAKRLKDLAEEEKNVATEGAASDAEKKAALQKASDYEESMKEKLEMVLEYEALEMQLENEGYFDGADGP